MIHDSSSDYQDFLKGELEKEQSQGYYTESLIQESIVKIKMESNSPKKVEKAARGDSRRLHRIAKSVQSFLEKNDPLRQYVVEVRSQVEKDSASGKEYGTIRIRRGYNRIFNSTIVLKESAEIPWYEYRGGGQKNDLGSVLAILKALPLKTLHVVFANAISFEDAPLADAVIDVYTQHLICKFAREHWTMILTSKLD